MSTYAKINSENIVENVIDCEDSAISTQVGRHIKVTENTNKASIGYTYNEEKNKFISIKIYESWTLNSDTLLWESPAGPMPTSGYFYWDEETLSWVEQFPGELNP